MLLQGIFLKITGVSIRRYLLFNLGYVIIPLALVWGIRVLLHAYIV